MEKFYKNILIAFYVFLLFFIPISILTYHPEDESILKQSINSSSPKNFFGYVGASFSAILFQLFGISAYFFIFLTFYYFFLFLLKIIKKSFESIFLNIIGAIIILIFISAFFSFLKQFIYFKGEEILSGGLIGESLKMILVKNFNTFGTLIVLLFFLSIGFLFFFSEPLKLARENFEIIKEKINEIMRRKKEEKIAEKVLKENENKIKGEKIKEAEVKEKQQKTLQKTIDYSYVLPDLNLLDEPEKPKEENNKVYMNVAKAIEKSFQAFQVNGKVEAFRPGPVVTTYEFTPAGGTKISKILSLQEDLALALKVYSVRIDRIPGMGSVGIEVPNSQINKIFIKTILESENFLKSTHPLTVGLGMDIYGIPYITSLALMPHLLVAGTTGSGKSVLLNCLILSLLYRYHPKNLKLILIDLKKVEFSIYEDLPHLLVPVVSNPKEAMASLIWATEEMERRSAFLKQSGMKNLENYNSEVQRVGGKEILPYIVIFIDELAELMFSTNRTVENPIVRLAQMARAVGIHLVVATQRPSVDVITGLIKANFPARIALRVADKTNSRLVLDDNGAERLLGQGDMLFISPQISKIKRLHGAYVSPQELQRVVKFIKSQAKPQYIDNILNTSIPYKIFPEQKEEDEEKDPLFKKSVCIVLRDYNASATHLQRRLKIGFAKAGRFIDLMQKKGIVGPPQGAKPREILIPPEEVERFLKENGYDEGEDF